MSNPNDIGNESRELNQASKPQRAHRGFAAMDVARQKEIASKGGRAAHESGHAHEFTSEEARRAGRKGGQIVSLDRAHMSAIGAKGGARSHIRSAARTTAPVSIGPDIATLGSSEKLI